jgi:hypothetical protein
VRPRVRGRFDPPVWPAEGALNHPAVNRALQQPARTSEIESPASQEERYDSSSPAKKPADRLAQHTSPSGDREQNEVARSRTAETETINAAALSVSTFRAASESIPPTQPAHEAHETHVTAPSREHRNTVGETSRTASPPAEVATTGDLQPRDRRDVDSNKSTVIESPPKARSPESPGVIETSTPQYNAEATSHFPTSAPRRVIERETKEVFVRDRQARVAGESSNRFDPAPRIADATPAGRIAPSESRPIPSAIQPRVELLAAVTPERLAVHQSERQVEPTVHVTIGRIEVRAVQQPSQTTAKPRATQPVMNLDDYLRRRGQGGAR